MAVGTLDLGYHRMPRQLCQERDINLEPWTLGVSDESLRYITDTAILRIFDGLCESCHPSMDNRYRIMQVFQNAFVRTGCGTRISKADIIQKCNVSDDRVVNEAIRLWDNAVLSHGLRSVNLCGADKITDSGLNRLATVARSLKWLNIDNVHRITGDGLSLIVTQAAALQHLSLASCKGIAGTAFAVIGQECKTLKTLILSKCAQITTSALRSIFQGCNLLEVLNLSYCTDLTDAELHLLRCKNLQKIILKECVHVSDSGFHSIAMYSPRLEEVDCTRNSMTFKFTDSTLMSLGEKCKYIKKLSLNGCRLISDLGISWLAQGCTQLEHLDLSGCVDLTNMAAAHLGNHCPALKTLSLFGLKCMSDTAVRAISDGCEGLAELDLGQLYFLTDGKKRKFGQEGLQALCASACAPSMKQLKLHGCFQMGTLALRSISKLAGLEVLDVSSCTKLTLDGMISMAHSCPKIHTLNLSNCGDCCTDSMLEQMLRVLQHLENINLSRCWNASNRALIGLASCPELQTVNLSECSAITDKCMVSFCEALCHKPKIRELNLSKCSKVGNEGTLVIARTLANGDGSRVDNSLTMLSLKGTSISRAAARAMERYFRYSTLHCEEKFYGFRPLPRIQDKHFVQYHLISSMARERLGRRCRRYVIQWKVQLVCRAEARARAAVFAQKAQKSGHAHLLASRLRAAKAHETASVVRIQKLGRNFASKKVIRQIKQCLARSRAEKAACTIQKSVRQGFARATAATAREVLRELQWMQANGSRTIQCLARKSKADSVLLFKRRARDEKDRRECWASLEMQKCARKKSAHRELERLAELKRKRERLEASAANFIANTYGCFAMRKAAKQTLHFLRVALQKTVIIQTFWRMMMSLNELRNRQAEQLRHRKYESALTIQRFARACKALMKLRDLQSQRLAWENLKLSKAPVIVLWCRYALAQKKVTLAKYERKIFEEEWMAYQVYCATAISSFWRKIKAIKRTKEARVQKNGQWKQMWCNDNNKPFYYNQLTGEMRWRQPTAVLEMQQRPVCDNCQFYEAQIECASCHEYFCQTCFGNVHSGGKRAAHSFRSLYDFYDKRLDHGDGEFPSKWPSEIQQDASLTVPD
jgi:Ran GTPase-activating protein (RanGAP) involved in mRNA processing and transport